MTRRRLIRLGLLVLLVTGCRIPAPPVPDPDTAHMEAPVRLRIEASRRTVLAEEGSAAAWGRLGMVLHVHGLHEEAIPAYRHALALEATDARWPYFLGDVLSIVGTELDEAVVAFRLALELRPDYAAAHMRLGDALAKQGELESAEAAYSRALELAPDFGPAVLGLGQVRSRQGHDEAALPLLERAAELLPNSAPALFALGRSYQRVGRTEEADGVARRARSLEGVDFFPDPLMEEVVAQGVSSSLIWDRARRALEAGQLERALADLKRVLAVRADDPDLHYQLAAVYEETRQPRLALEHMEKVLALDPARVPQLRVRLAVSLIEADRAQEAVGHLSRALAEAPDDGRLHALRGRALARSGALRQAVAEFEAAAALGPVEGWVHNDWGNALAQGRRYAQAIGHFERALEEKPRNAQTLFQLGLALEAVGRPDEARGHYEKAMQIEPNPLIGSRLAALSQ